MLKTIEIQRFAVRGEHRWIFVIQTSESLGTASVRRATPAEIVEVIEIAAPLHAELGSPSSSRHKRFVHSEFYQRDVTDGMRLAWKFLIVVVSQSSQEVGKAVWKLENTAPAVIEMGFHSSVTVDVEHCTTSTRWSMSRVVQVEQVPQVQVMERTVERVDRLKNR